MRLQNAFFPEAGLHVRIFSISFGGLKQRAWIWKLHKAMSLTEGQPEGFKCTQGPHTPPLSPPCECLVRRAKCWCIYCTSYPQVICFGSTLQPEAVVCLGGKGLGSVCSRLCMTGDGAETGAGMFCCVCLLFDRYPRDLEIVLGFWRITLWTNCCFGLFQEEPSFWVKFHADKPPSWH